MEFTEHQKAVLVHAARLTPHDYRYASRRERIAAHLLAAMIAGTGKNPTELAINTVQNRLIETALSLTDKLIVKLAEEVYGDSLQEMAEEESTEVEE
jgi:hypothetical protein